jgi:hypothetical protein
MSPRRLMWFAKAAPPVKNKFVFTGSRPPSAVPDGRTP